MQPASDAEAARRRERELSRGVEWRDVLMPSAIPLSNQKYLNKLCTHLKDISQLSRPQQVAPVN